jgi:hypothetical protein
LRQKLSEWTRARNNSNRLFPGSLIWCIKKPGRDLRTETENWLAWRRVRSDIQSGTLGQDFDTTELDEVETKHRNASEDVKDEVWASYRYIAFFDSQEVDGLRVIDLGQGHAGSGETLCGRIISALKAESLLNESVGAGYIDRNWPPALQDSAAWPLSSLRKSFLDGSLTRLLDPDAVLRIKLLEFVQNGDFGLAAGRQPDDDYNRIWFTQMVPSDEVTFDSDVFLLRKLKAAELKMKALRGRGAVSEPPSSQQPPLGPEILGGGQPLVTEPTIETPPVVPPTPATQPSTKILHLSGNIPSEMWNRLGTKIIPKLKSNGELQVGVKFEVTINADNAQSLRTEIVQILGELGVDGEFRVEIR